MIAALFVQEGGCYFGLKDVDPWPESRDARLYDGCFPVVAHQPCQRWGSLAVVNFARWGGEHNRPKNDGGCFESALANVRRCGGVLEHPAKTMAFAEYELGKPSRNCWTQINCGGWICEVWQSAYGHRANKAIWLYFNSPSGVRPFDLILDRPKGSHQVGYQDKRGKGRNKPTLSKREANATPILFRDALIKLAIHSSINTGKA